MPAPAPPEVVDAALMAVADGASQREAGELVGVEQQSVSRWLSRWQERREKLGTMLHVRWLKRTFRGVDRVHGALMRVVEDERVDDKGRPVTRGSDKAQAANVILSHAMPAGPESLTIVGDVDASVNVSADVRIVVAQGSDADALRAKAEELRSKLGF